MLAFSSSPSIRTITTLLKNNRDTDTTTKTDNNDYGITRGAAYWKKGGGGNAE